MPAIVIPPYSSSAIYVDVKLLSFVHIFNKCDTSVFQSFLDEYVDI